MNRSIPPGTIAPVVETYTRSRPLRATPGDRRSCITYKRSRLPRPNSQGPSQLKYKRVREVASSGQLPSTVAPVVHAFRSRSRLPRPAPKDRRSCNTIIYEKSPPAANSQGPSLLRTPVVQQEIAPRGQLLGTVAPVVQMHTRSRLPQPTSKHRRSCSTNLYEKSPPKASSPGPSLR